MKKYAVNLWVWYPEINKDSCKAFYKAEELGYKGIEIPTFDGKLDLEILKQILSSTKLVPIIVGGCLERTDISSESYVTRKKGIEYIKRCIIACNKLGGNIVCGPFYTSVGKALYLNDLEKQKKLSIVANSLNEVAKIGLEYNVNIAIEPLCRYDTYLINTTSQGMQLLQMVSRENVGLLLDTFHMNIEESSIFDAIKSAGKRLYHFQLCENNRGIPGTGHINWDEVALALNQINYGGWISFESFTPYYKDFALLMHSWRKLAESQDELALKALLFMKKKFGS